MLASITDQLLRASVHLATTPAPVTPDEDTVTPGVVGFIVTFLVAVAAVLLALDMVRRVRRVNYRAQVRDQLAAEQTVAEAEQAVAEAATDAPAPGDRAPRAGVEDAGDGETPKA